MDMIFIADAAMLQQHALHGHNIGVAYGRSAKRRAGRTKKVEVPYRDIVPQAHAAVEIIAVTNTAPARKIAVGIDDVPLAHLKIAGHITPGADQVQKARPPFLHFQKDIPAQMRIAHADNKTILSGDRVVFHPAEKRIRQRPQRTGKTSVAEEPFEIQTIAQCGSSPDTVDKELMTFPRRAGIADDDDVVHGQYRPPSRIRLLPLIQRARSESRNIAAAATSSGSPTPSG